MRLRKPLSAQLLLLIALLGAFGAGSYYVLYSQDIAGACLLILFIWLALSTKMERRGAAVIYIPALVIAFLVILYAWVFSLRVGAPLLPSVLAQRDWVYFLLGPVVYMLHMRGWRLADFGRVFVFAAAVTVADYTLALFTIDLESWLTSGDFYQQSSVTYDEWRGYRLKGPMFTALFVALFFGRRTLWARNPFALIYRLALTVLPLTVVLINAPRQTVVSVVVALILYSLFLSRAKLTGLFRYMLPILAALAIFVAPYAVNALTTTLNEDPSYSVRIETMETSWDYFSEYPLLGFGVASYKSMSYQDLFGHRFYPEDVGLLGVAFKFGLVGLFLYMCFAFWVCVSLLYLLQAYYEYDEPTGSALLWALYVICLGYLIVSPLNAGYVYPEGIAFGSFAWGLLLAHKHSLPGGLRGNLGIDPRLPTTAKPVGV